MRVGPIKGMLLYEGWSHYKGRSHNRVLSYEGWSHNMGKSYKRSWSHNKEGLSKQVFPLKLF